MRITTSEILRRFPIRIISSLLGIGRGKNKRYLSGILGGIRHSAVVVAIDVLFVRSVKLGDLIF